MKRSHKLCNKKAVSTVFGSVLFIILFVGLASTLFVSLIQYNKDTQTGMELEQARLQEKILIDNIQIQKIDAIDSVTAIHINNVGPTTVQIRSLYINQRWIADPSISINPKETVWVNLPTPEPYNPIDTITSTSDLGTKAMVLEGDFGSKPVATPPPQISFGPLKLTYEEFKYEPLSIYPSPTGWIDGWTVFTNTGEVIWRIHVKNVDDYQRSIQLTPYSCLTLIDNDGGSRTPWYLEKITTIDGSAHSFTIDYDNIGVYLYYRYSTSDPSKTQSIPSDAARCRVFLTFFGYFDDPTESSPYGQTIPFEGVTVIKP